MKLRKLVSGALLVGAVALTASPVWAKNTIRWASQGDALTADPHAANESPTHSASRKIYDSLYYNDKDMKNTRWLAVSEKLLDPTTWEIQLRKGVKFHDGSDFTAEDVKFTIERALSPTSDLKNDISSIKEVKIVDSHTVQIITKEPNPILRNQLTNVFIMSKAWCEKHNVTAPQDLSLIHI